MVLADENKTERDQPKFSNSIPRNIPTKHFAFELDYASLWTHLKKTPHLGLVIIKIMLTRDFFGVWPSPCVSQRLGNARTVGRDVSRDEEGERTVGGGIGSIFAGKMGIPLEVDL
jgi:hypothetical protein